VDIFARPNRTFGFEEFRCDPEDMGEWTAVAHYRDAEFVTSEASTGPSDSGANTVSGRFAAIDVSMVCTVPTPYQPVPNAHAIRDTLTRCASS
jgi:hypothetical protein